MIFSYVFLWHWGNSCKHFPWSIEFNHVSPTTLKKREKEAGVAFGAVADETCCEALLEEKSRQVSIIYYVLYSVRKLYNLLIVIVFIFIP